jgi:hypothetical protein
MNEQELQQLERFQRLRECGALTEEEFLGQKSKLLAGEEPLFQRKRQWPLYAILTVSALAAAIALGIWSTRSAVPPTSSHLGHNTTKLPVVLPQPTTAIPIRSPAERLADAFEAATGHRSTFSQDVDGEIITTRPVRIIELPFGPALLTKREIKDGCHACTGAIGVYYLKEQGNATIVTGRWPKAIEGWGWGAAPSKWSLTDKFTALPSIYAAGGYMGQGVIEESATITELRPDGPVTSDVIGTGFSDEGAIVDNERAPCVVEGRIGNVYKDRSFDVIVTGSVRAVDHYVNRSGKFVAASKIDWGVPCGTAS